MSSAVVPGNGSFVRPHFIEELGCEGLTLHEVAQSLEVEFSKVKTKFERMLSDNRVKSLHAHTEVVYDQGLTTERRGYTYCLATETAKFFVAKWDSETGDAYTRFLIACEQVLTELSPELRYMIKIEQTQKQHQKLLETMQATITAANDDSTLKASEIVHLENLFSELRRASGGNHQLVSRTRTALKAQFLSCNRAGMTYKDIASKHYAGCVALIKAQIETVGKCK